jgi:hypothetical protein
VLVVAWRICVLPYFNVDTRVQIRTSSLSHSVCRTHSATTYIGIVCHLMQRVCHFRSRNKTPIAESGLFHSTTSGLLSGSTSQVYASGYNGSVYATAAPPLVLSGRLHVVTADVVFTHLSARSAILSLAAPSQGQDAADDASPSTRNSVNNIGSSVPPRDELCLHIEEAVVRVSTVVIATPPQPSGPGHFLKPTANETTRNSVTCAISVGEVQLWETYSGVTYDVLRAHCTAQQGRPALPPQKQVIVTFHSLQDSRRIYSSPHVNVTLDYLPAAEKCAQLSPGLDANSCASIKAAVTFEPIIISASVAMIEHWVQGLSGFPLISVAEEESSTNIACTLKFVQVELFLHCDSRAESYRAISLKAGQSMDGTPEMGGGGSVDAHTAYWDTILDALDLTQHPEGWVSLHSTVLSSPYYEHLIATRGGFRFLLNDISIKLVTAARPKIRPSIADSTLLGGSVSSAEKKALRANSAEALFQAVEMAQVALYVYVSLPASAQSAEHVDLRRRFYSTLLVKATASDDGLHKVMISRSNPNATPAVTRQASEDPEDQEFVLLRDAYRTAPSAPGQPRSAEKAGGGATGNAGATTADPGPSAPAINAAALIYVSAYHIQAGKWLVLFDFTNSQR